MKKQLLLLTLLPLFSCLVTNYAIAQEVKSQKISSEIDEVKLYLTAGQMIHHQEITLDEGRNELVFTGVSAFADPQSIQFKAEGDYRLVSVSTEMDFLAAETYNPRISVLKDSLEALQHLLQNTRDIQDSYQAEKILMTTNRDLGGNAENLTVAQISAAVRITACAH